MVSLEANGVYENKPEDVADLIKVNVAKDGKSLSIKE